MNAKEKRATARAAKAAAKAQAEAAEAATVVDAAATEVDNKTPRSKAAQLKKYKSGYQTYQGPTGNLSMDNGDAVALVLRGASPEAVMAAAEKLKGLEPGTLVERYKLRNPGARRMNSGNIIRALVRSGDKEPGDVTKAIKEVSKQLNTPALAQKQVG
jgi:hypothetical protein